MSSPCTIVSPSQEAAGPGGALRVSTRERYSATRSASLRPALTWSMSLRVRAWKLKPVPINLPKKRGGVISAVAIMCATTSRTVQPVHSDGLSQSASGSLSSASTSPARSAPIICHVSMRVV